MWWYPEELFFSQCISLCLSCVFLTHQDALQESQEANVVTQEDTETDELWASLEAAAKRKLPDLDQTQGVLQTSRKKKKRPGSTSP